MPWRSVSSQMRKASIMDVFLSTISSRRSLGMTMRVLDLLGEQIDTLVGLVAAKAPLEGEGLGDDAHGKGADLFAGDLGHDGGRARGPCRRPRRR